MLPIQGMAHFPFQRGCLYIWNDLEKCNIPDIQGVYQHALGIMVISLRQRYAGHAKQAALIAAGSWGAERSRFIITVDEDIDPSNIQQVLWAMATRCEPERDVEVVKECWIGSIDPGVPQVERLRSNFTTGRVIINACRPIYRRGEFPRVVTAGPEAKATALKRWWDAIK